MQDTILYTEATSQSELIDIGWRAYYHRHANNTVDGMCRLQEIAG